ASYAGGQIATGHTNPSRSHGRTPESRLQPVAYRRGYAAVTPTIANSICQTIGELGRRWPSMRFGQLAAHVCAHAAETSPEDIEEVDDLWFLAAAERTLASGSRQGEGEISSVRVSLLAALDGLAEK